jgi:hypothetical protein
MADKVQAKSNQVDPSLFHFSIIKLLVLEELKKSKREWNSFLAASRFGAETINSPPSKGSTPSTSTKTVSGSLKRKKGDNKEQPILIETPETAPMISLSKESIKRGKMPFQGVEIIVYIEKTPDSRRRKLKGKKLIFTPEEVKVTKLRKPFTRSATKKQNHVDENHVEEDPIDEDPVDEIPTDETFPCLEVKDVVEYKPPSCKKVRFSPEILSKESLGRPVTRSPTRK